MPSAVACGDLHLRESAHKKSLQMQAFFGEFLLTYEF